MSSFACKYCGARCHHTKRGYISGCEHYPTDVDEEVKESLDAADIKFLRLLASGKTNAMAAEELSCSMKKIVKRRSDICRFLNVRNAFQLGMAAKGILER